mgnify:CR=1 FL=1
MANTKPIGVAYSDQDISGADSLMSNIKLGYTVAGQGTVTQATSKTTAVTLNKSAGVITTFATSMLTATNATFTLNNSLISANDTIILTIASGQATAGSYNVFCSALAAGTASITLRNISAGTLAEAVVINFALIHCD